MELKQLATLMVDRGISYRDLEKLTDIPSSTLQRYVNGTTEKLPLDRISTIAHALKIPVARLIGSAAEGGDWTNRFREGLKQELDQLNADRTDINDCGFDIDGAYDIANGTVGFSFEDACQLADELGTSIDLLIDWCGVHGKSAEAYKKSLVADDTVDLTLMALLIKKKQNCSIEEAEKKAEIIASCIQTKELSDELLQLNLAPKELQDIIRAALNQSKSDS